MFDENYIKKMAIEENKREKDHPTIGYFRIEDADDSEKNPLHPHSHEWANGEIS